MPRATLGFDVTARAPLVVLLLLLLLLAALVRAATVDVNCTYDDGAVTDDRPNEITCVGNVYTHAEELITPNSGEFWVYIGICVALVLGAGMMSGLTIGLVALDPNAITVIMRSGTEAAEERARGELGMIRHAEVFVQILPPEGKPPESKVSDAKPSGASSAVASRPSDAKPSAAATKPPAPPAKPPVKPPPKPVAKPAPSMNSTPPAGTQPAQ